MMKVNSMILITNIINRINQAQNKVAMNKAKTMNLNYNQMKAIKEILMTNLAIKK